MLAVVEKAARVHNLNVPMILKEKAPFL